MRRFSVIVRLTALLLTLLLAGCGQISEETYRRAEEFGGGLRDFLPAEESAPSSRPAPSGSSTPSGSPEESAGPGEPDLPENSGAGLQDGAGYYRTFLTAAQQAAYDQLLAALQDGKASAAVETASLEELTPAVRALYYDHPEFFWLQNAGTLTSAGGRSEYRFDICVEEAAREEMQAGIDMAVESFLSRIPSGATEYQKVRLVFEYLVDTIDYDASGAHSGSIYGALVERKARCEGYSRAAQYLLGQLGVFCTYVSGDTLDGQPHGWNLVSIDGEYYHMDATWGDPSFSGGSTPVPGYRNYAYLCATTEEILLSRTIDQTCAPIPSCTARTHNYFAENGLLFSEYPGEIGQVLADQYRAGARFVPLCFTSEEIYRRALAALFEENEIFELLESEQLPGGSVQYLSDDSFRVITILFP